MEKLIKIGVMPGRISELAVAVGTPIADVIAMADLDPKGYDVKVDGTVVTDLSTPINDSTNLILLVVQVKGN